MFIATLIAADRLTRGDISAAADALASAGIPPGAANWVEQGSACDLPFERDPGAARAALEGRIAGVDVVVQPRSGRAKKLLVADMDSTIIGVECIDELADYAGVKSEVAAVTERAMRGELDFAAALDARAALLAGLEESAIDRCLAERVRPNPGAAALVATMRGHGAWCLLVTGGFTRFAAPVAKQLGFDGVAANALLVEDGRLTGKVGRPVLGAAGKLEALVAAATARSLDLALTMAVGDGANDVPMLKAAGLGIAYRAKPAAAAAADARIESNSLSALLWAQGWPRSIWRDPG